MRDSGVPGRQTTTFVTVTLVAALVLILGSLGATSSWGPLVEVQRPTTTPPPPPPPPEPSPSFTAPGNVEHLPEPPPVPEIPEWLGQLVIAVGVAALAGLVIWFLSRVARAVRSPDLRRARAPMGAAEEAPEVDEEQVAESLSRTIASLRSGMAVDDAVVECWHRLEAIAADSGVERGPAQTSQEFTASILGHSVVDQTALADLAALYRRAMFSTHVLSDKDRHHAIDCLERLSAQFGSGVPDAH